MKKLNCVFIMDLILWMLPFAVIRLLTCTTVCFYKSTKSCVARTFQQLLYFIDFSEMFRNVTQLM